MQSPFSHVLLRGNYHEANFGDDALLLACSALLSFTEGEVVIDGKGATYHDERMSNVSNNQPGDQKPNLICYGGGTQFFSLTPPAVRVTMWQRVLRKLISPKDIVSSIRARVNSSRSKNTMTIAIGMGVGPFKKDIEAELSVAKLLKRMDFVWVRDRLSENFCKDHGIDHAVFSSDLCFTDAFSRLVNPVTPKTSRLVGIQKIKVGFILRDWELLDPDFFKRQIEVAKRLRLQGYEVRFLCLATSDHSYLEELKNAGEDVDLWTAKQGAFESFWELISSQDLIVTSRFHGAIFALLSQRPFVAIEIEQKLQNLREMVPGSERFALDHKASADHVEKKVLNALGCLEEFAPILAESLKVQRKRAKVGETALKKFLQQGRYVD